MNRTLYGLVAAAAIAFGACAHSKQVESKEPGERATTQSRAFQSKPGRPTVSAQPKKAFKSDSVTEIQERLGVKKTGELDDATQQALMKFQEKRRLPATGFPDTHTLEELGIRAADAQKQAGTKQERKRTDEREGERSKHVDTSKKD